jgi:succinyl-diaminopimelate desuccinylase
LDFVSVLRKAISFDTTPAHGNRDYVRWLSELCHGFGFDIEVIEEYQGDLEQANILVRPHNAKSLMGAGLLGVDEKDVEVIFQSHLDTVDPGSFSLWEKNHHNPFDASIVDGAIYGIGTADVKLDFLCKLWALKRFPQTTRWKRIPLVMGTYGEETGMHGILRLIRKNRFRSRFALVGEPTDLKIVTAAKGIASVEIRIPLTAEEREYRSQHNLEEITSTQSKMFLGRAAHSSMPQMGDSAIVKMLDYLLQIPDSTMIMDIEGGINFNTVPSHAFLEVDIGATITSTLTKRICAIYRVLKSLSNEFVNHAEEGFLPSHTTLIIGLIRATPTHVLIQGNCRIPPRISQETYDGWMKQLKNVCDENQAEFAIADYKKAFRTSADSVLVTEARNAARDLGLDQGLHTQASTNESSLLSRVGVDCFCFGPGVREGNIHTPTEHVKLSDLEKAIDFYEAMMRRMCL